MYTPQKCIKIFPIFGKELKKQEACDYSRKP